MQYIDRDKLIKELSTMYKCPTSTEDSMTIGYDHAIADVVVTVNRQPTVEAEPVRHGKWVEIPDEIFASTTFPSPCTNCRNNPVNGGSGICHCILGVQTIY